MEREQIINLSDLYALKDNFLQAIHTKYNGALIVFADDKYAVFHAVDNRIELVTVPADKNGNLIKKYA